MAFPAVQTESTSQEISNVTLHDVVIPASTAAGDLLLLFISIDGAPTLSLFPTGWTQINRQSEGNVVLESWYLIAAGGEANFQFTSSATEMSVNRCFRINTWHGTTPPEGAGVTDAASTAPDPPSLDPAGWATEDTLWFAAAGHDNGQETVTAYPTSYTDGLNDRVNDTAGVGLGTCRRALAAASDDPAAFTISAIEDSCSQAVAVRPAAGGAAADVRNHIIPAFMRMQ